MRPRLASVALSLAALLCASNAPHAGSVPFEFKPFRVFYAVTNGHHVLRLEVGVPFATREGCDAWRRLDVTERLDKPVLSINGDDYLILGSYCRAAGIET